MKGVLAALVSLSALVGIGCAHKELNPGRCNSNSDCSSGQTCDLSPQANGTCVCASPGCIDGGAGASGSGGASATGGSGGMGGLGGMQDGSAGAGGCQPACAAPKICANNICVDCVTSADCATTTKPICDTATSTCVSCTSDDQCLAKLGPDPGVCMAHQDGRCAAVDETIYVQNDITTCSDTATTDPGFGTVMKPLCSMQPVPSLLSTTKDLVLVRGTVPAGTASFSGQGGAQTTIVGQKSAQVGSIGSPAITVQLGNLYVRGVEFSSTGSVCLSVSGGTVSLHDLTVDNCKQGGINATGGSIITSHVTVDSCAGGGILLGGAAFDIEDTTVTNNGPGSQGTSGGIVVSALPANGGSTLHLVTVQTNKAVGITCAASAPITSASGVYATGNTGVDIAQTCGFASCQTPSTTCGAQ